MLAVSGDGKIKEAIAIFDVSITYRNDVLMVFECAANDSYTAEKKCKELFLEMCPLKPGIEIKAEAVLISFK